MDKIRTGISQAFWYNYEIETRCIKKDCCARYTEENCKEILQSKLKPALLKFGDEQEENVHWFDVLFDGGIRIPSSAKPVTFLLTGPPGSGKSTLLLEIAYRLAMNKYWGDDILISKEKKLNNIPYSTLYVSFDTGGEALIENAENYGWEESRTIFFNYTPEEQDFFKSIKEVKDKILKEQGLVTILDKKSFNHNKESYNEEVGKGLDIIFEAVTQINTGGLFSELINKRKNRSQKDINKLIKDSSPKILILDSLNIIPRDKQEEYFNKIISKINDNKNNTIELIFIVVDESGSKNNYFEYVADIVTRLDYTSEIEDYFVRNIEILKTRYQNHVLGKHYFKINPKVDLTDGEKSKTCDINIKHQRTHPYREKGGVFILPSIHFYLSKYRKLTAPLPQERLKVYPFELDDIFRLPNGRTTSFIGSRGTHRSHLAYLQSLYHLLQDDCCSLIVSLREDEKLTKDTIQKIYYSEFSKLKNNKRKYDETRNNEISMMKKKFQDSKKVIDYYIDKNQLEILYFLPGYITPNEFFHRLFINVNRMKYNNPNKNIIVVFNSIEQILPRFPLCSNENLFISSIIDLFHGMGITGIFIGVDTQGSNLDEYGLLPHSDLIVSFHNYRIKRILKKREKEVEENVIKTISKVVKISGGFNAGKKGILELDEKTGMHFTLLDPNFKEEERLLTI